MAQEEFRGIGSIKNLSNILAQLPAKTIFLVTGKKSFEMSGASEKVNRILAPYTVIRFSDFAVNPKIEDIERGIALMKQCSPDAVLSVGGGSAMDTAKIINALAFQERALREYIFKKAEMQSLGKPLIAIPTTAGTGAEATKFAVVYIDKKKYSLEHESILPHVVILDPQLTFDLPPAITAATGMDALCQAIESYWSVNSDDESKRYAVEAVTLVWKNLPIVVIDPTPSAREQMLYGANVAGKAINISKTTAPHACSYVLSARFGIPHGHAVGLTLGAFLAYNAHVTEVDVIDARGVEYVRKTMREICALLECTNAMEARKKLNALMKGIGLETSLADMDIIKREDKQYIIEHVNLERLSNNPRRVTREALENIFEL